MKKFIGIIAVVAVAVIAAWNFNQSKKDADASDLTLENLEAIAQGRGIFPACQKKELSSGDRKTIPFCVSGKCESVKQIPYMLDVNYCSENPHQ